MLKLACIPAYNEENTISDVIKRSLNYVDKVIVCDDGSSDQTVKRAKEAGATVIQHEKNLGKGVALRSLLNYGKQLNSDVLVTIDGDGQFLPEEMNKLIAPVLHEGIDIVIGYRFDSSTEMPSYRKAGNKMLDKITNLASDLPFRDTQSGYRAYSKKAVEMINFLTDGFGADSEILIDASRKGLKISEEKVTVLYNTGTKTSTKNPLSHTTDVIGSLIELVALRHPLKYLGIPGLILTLIGIAFGISTISYFNQTRVFSIPSTLIAVGFTIIGIIMVLMSVVLFSIVRTSKRGL